MPNVYLTFDDMVCNHATTVAPLLRSYGWSATFFITLWNEEWRARHGETLMTGEQLRQLASWGFELGNHTLNHLSPKDDPLAYEKQIDALEQYFIQERLPRAVSFAYPGGPYNPSAVPILQSRGYRCARCVESRPLHQHEDLFRLPAYPIHDDAPEQFDAALAEVRQGHEVILCYHGVPDLVHPWVHTSPENFARQMTQLREANATGMSLTYLG